MAHPGGRPTDYTPELADRICELVATSTIGTNKLCKMYEWMPDNDTIYKWRYRHAEFADKYALAKAKQAELMVEDIIDISDESANYTYTDAEGNQRVDSGAIAAKRLSVDSRKWYASKLAPKIYGERKAEDKEQDASTTLMQKLIDKL